MQLRPPVAVITRAGGRLRRFEARPTSHSSCLVIIVARSADPKSASTPTGRPEAGPRSEGMRELTVMRWASMRHDRGICGAFRILPSPSRRSHNPLSSFPQVDSRTLGAPGDVLPRAVRARHDDTGAGYHYCCSRAPAALSHTELARATTLSPPATHMSRFRSKCIVSIPWSKRPRPHVFFCFSNTL